MGNGMFDGNDVWVVGPGFCLYPQHIGTSKYLQGCSGSGYCCGLLELGEGPFTARTRKLFQNK